MTAPIDLEGTGLHSGTPVRVRLSARPGPPWLSTPVAGAPLQSWRVASTARATTVESPGGDARVGTVEHLLSALAGLGIHQGVGVHVEGGELPLLDGGATAWCDALARLGVPPSVAPFEVTRAATYDSGPSRYTWTPSREALRVSVHVDLADDRYAPDAAWAGDPGDYLARIAPARTFTLARDVEELVRRGLARHVDPSSVVVLAPEGPLHAGRPFSPDEPARHKLLDLLGDLYLHGGLARGHLHVERPGHASNARALRRALDEGIVAPLASRS